LGFEGGYFGAFGCDAGDNWDAVVGGFDEGGDDGGLLVLG